MPVTILRKSLADEEQETFADETDDTSSGADKGKRVRGRSTIEFPYADLDDAVLVARTIRDKGGVPLAKDQLAAAMGQPVTSGAFSAKIHASRLFGLVEFVMGKIKLTDLGFDAVEGDSNRAKGAKVKAFLTVPLFAKAYGEFRNRQLPPRPSGLEQAFVGFGVLATRGVNARWAFDRSARQAGFFEHGDDRLVPPVITWVDGTEPLTHAPEIGLKPEGENDARTKPRSLTSAAADEFLIRGLLARMPAPNTDWPLAERARWLRALSVNLAVLYGNSDEAELQIAVPRAAQEPLPTRGQVASRPKIPEPEPEKLAPRQESKAGGELDDEIPF